MDNMGMVGDIASTADNDKNMSADGQKSEAQINVASTASAKFFGAASLPARTSFAKAAAIDAEVDRMEALPEMAEWTLANGGPLNLKSRDERQREKDEEFRDQMATAAQQAERERAEWAKTYSEVGGVRMKGEEWSALAQRLRDDEKFRKDIIEAFKERGMSETEAEARVDRAASVAEAASVPPSQRTEQQKSDIAHADADPTFKRDMTIISQKMGTGHSAEASPEQQPSKPAPPAVVAASGPAF